MGGKGHLLEIIKILRENLSQPVPPCPYPVPPQNQVISTDRRQSGTGDPGFLYKTSEHSFYSVNNI